MSAVTAPFKLLKSVFDDPRIAAARPTLESVPEGRLVAADLAHRPVKLAEFVPAHLVAEGSGAAYDSRRNVLFIARQSLDDTTEARGQFALAHKVVHEGVHMRQRGSDVQYWLRRLTEPVRLAAAGVAAVARSLPSSADGAAETWRRGVTAHGARVEAEAYLVEHRWFGQVMEAHGQPHSTLGPLDQAIGDNIQRAEDALGGRRPLTIDDVVPAVLADPLYGFDDVARDLRQARHGVDQLLAGAVAASASAGLVAGAATSRD